MLRHGFGGVMRAARIKAAGGRENRRDQQLIGTDHYPNRHDQAATEIHLMSPRRGAAGPRGKVDRPGATRFRDRLRAPHTADRRWWTERRSRNRLPASRSAP